VDEFPEEFTARLIDTYWAKGAANVLCQNQETQDWLHSKVLEMKAERAPHTHNGRHGGPHHLQHHGSLVSEPSRRHNVLASVPL